MTTRSADPGRRATRAVVALAVLLLTAGGGALGSSFALQEEVRRLMRELGTDTTIFARIGQVSLTAAHLQSVAAPLAAGAVVSLLIALALHRTHAASIVRVDRRTLALLPGLGGILIALGGVAAVDYAGRQTVIGTLAEPGAEASLVFSADIANAFTTAGGIAAVTWLVVGALAVDASRARRIAPGVAVVALGAAAVVVLRLRSEGYVRMQGLYAGFYAATPDPRAAGREIVALQSRDLLYGIAGTSLLAVAAVGAALAVAALVLRSRVPITSR